MIDGLWTVVFQGPLGPGGGAVVLAGGKVLGGDSGFYYTGTYEEKGDNFTAKVSVKNFMPGVQSVFGGAASVELALTGKIQGGTINGSGAPMNMPQAKLTITLTKRA